jgi:hypothetical protein
MKLTTTQKAAIIQLIEQKKAALGSYSAVANFCDVSNAALTSLVKGTYKADGDDMIIAIGHKLGWKVDNDTDGWVHVETTDYRTVHQVFKDARKNKFFVGFSDVGGIGKSANLEYIAKQYEPTGVFYMVCKEWNLRELLEKWAQCLGINLEAGSLSYQHETITNHLLSLANRSPVMIFDEIDKLKPAAKRIIIPTYNDINGRAAFIASGGPSFEAEIKRGVKLKRLGYDEIDSRLARRYIKLMGATKGDTKKMAEANGIEGIQQATLNKLFDQCNPVVVNVETDDGQKVSVPVVKDVRMIRRAIETYILDKKAS